MGVRVDTAAGRGHDMTGNSEGVWIHAPAWAVAMSAIFLGASLPSIDSPTWIIVVAGGLGGILGGLSLGLISGLVARRLQPLTGRSSASG